MWRVSLAFFSHRAALYLVALLAINVSLAPKQLPANRSLPILQPLGLLDRHLSARISEVPEVRILNELRHQPLMETVQRQSNPYFWAGRVWMGMTGSSGLSTVFILSNLFFLLFLFELYKLLNLIVTTDISRAALYLAVFWPTSYELSLGSQVSLTCLLATFCIRMAVEQTWWGVGLAGALLLAAEPWFVGLLPLLALVFWTIQRHSPNRVMLTRAAMFLGPITAMFLWQYSSRGLPLPASGAGATLLGWVGNGNFGKLFQGIYTAQVLSFLLFLVGAATSLFSHGNWFYRVAPLWLLVCLVAWTPLDALASKLLVASICLEGVASLSSPAMNKTLQVAMWILGVWEVYNVFR